MEKKQNDYDVLKEFLSLPHNGTAVLEKFACLERAVMHTGGDLEGFVYIPGTRENSVLLLAHGDVSCGGIGQIRLVEKDGILRNEYGILGGDDRAGCAMLWQLRASGHGLLITDGEEPGSYGIKFLREKFPGLFEELNRKYQFMIQIDRCGARDFKCYKVGTDPFRLYVEQKTGFHEPDRDRGTDICHLCTRICGVNLSCGYYKEHTSEEYIVKEEWLHTLQILRKWLEEDLPKFELQ